MARREPDSFTVILRRWRGRLALWRNAQYRRDFFALMGVGLRGLGGVRLGVAVLLAAVTGAWLLQSAVDSPRQAFDLLAWLFAFVALIAGASIYSSEQEQGTFELLWLARGSAKALLRFRVLVLLTGLALLMVPSVLLVSWFLYWTLPPGMTLVFLLTNALLIVSLCAAVGTYLPQAWASGLTVAVAAASVFVLGHDQMSFFNVFLNPVGGPESIAAGGGAFSSKVPLPVIAAANRALVVVLAAILLSTASRRLKRIIR